MAYELKSTLNEPRFTATCKHCNMSFGDFSWKDLIEHLGEHEIGIHFENVTVKTRLVPDEEPEEVCISCDLGPDECECEDFD